MDVKQNLYFILMERNEVSDGLSVEQLANVRLTAKQLINKNSEIDENGNPIWKEASEFTELHNYIQQKPSPPKSVATKPLPPKIHTEVEEIVVAQPMQYSNNSTNNPNSFFTDIANKYTGLEQKQKQYIKYGVVLLLLLFGVYHFNNSNNEADLKKQESILSTLTTELAQKNQALRLVERDVATAQGELRYAKRKSTWNPTTWTGRSPEERQKDINEATNRLNPILERRNELRGEIESINTQIDVLKKDIEKLREKCGKD